MGMQKSVIIMSNTTDNYDVLGEQFRTDSWYGYTDGFQTISITYQHFYGDFHLQGTLSTSPGDGDWFDVKISDADATIPYLEFNGESGIKGINFRGNFTFVRASMERSSRLDLEPNPSFPELSKSTQGTIDKVILAM